MKTVTGRRMLLKGAAAAMAAPMLNLGAHQVFADDTKTWSTRVVGLVKQNLVIDMLAPLTLVFTPDQYAKTLSPAEVEMFRTSGVNVFHHSVGVGAYDDVMAFTAGWQGFLAR